MTRHRRHRRSQQPLTAGPSRPRRLPAWRLPAGQPAGLLACRSAARTKGGLGRTDGGSGAASIRKHERIMRIEWPSSPGHRTYRWIYRRGRRRRCRNGIGGGDGRGRAHADAGSRTAAQTRTYRTIGKWLRRRRRRRREYQRIIAGLAHGETSAKLCN